MNRLDSLRLIYRSIAAWVDMGHRRHRSARRLCVRVTAALLLFSPLACMAPIWITADESADSRYAFSEVFSVDAMFDHFMSGDRPRFQSLQDQARHLETRIKEAVEQNHRNIVSILNRDGGTCDTSSCRITFYRRYANMIGLFKTETGCELIDLRFVFQYQNKLERIFIVSPQEHSFPRCPEQ